MNFNINSKYFCNDFKCNICNNSLESEIINILSNILNNTDLNIEDFSIFITDCNCLFHKSCIYKNNYQKCQKCEKYYDTTKICKLITNNFYYKRTKKFKLELSEDEIESIKLHNRINILSDQESYFKYEFFEEYNFDSIT